MPFPLKKEMLHDRAVTALLNVSYQLPQTAAESPSSATAEVSTASADKDRFRTQLQYLLNDIQTLISIFAEWEGRKNFPRYVPFQAHLFSGETDTVEFSNRFSCPTMSLQILTWGFACAQKKDKKRRPELEALLKNRWEDGVYFVVLFCTENRILVDEQDHVPAVKLQLTLEEALQIDHEHPDFLWLVELGRNWGGALKPDLAPSLSSNRVKTALLRGAIELKQLMKTSELGVPFDRPVHLATDVSRFCFVLISLVSIYTTSCLTSIVLVCFVSFHTVESPHIHHLMCVL